MRPINPGVLLAFSTNKLSFHFDLSVRTPYLFNSLEYVEEKYADDRFADDRDLEIGCCGLLVPPSTTIDKETIG